MYCTLLCIAATRYTQNMIHPAKRIILILVACCGLFIVNLLLGPLAAQPKAQRVSATYHAESTALDSAINTLGIEQNPEVISSCTISNTTHWTSTQRCATYSTYTYNDQPLSAEKQATYSQHAAKLDALLAARGWTPDRPQDTIKTLASSNPYLASNGGTGGQVPFHKNIGAISCNLEIDYNGLDSTTGPSPGALNVNQFSCQEEFSYTQFHLLTRRESGP